MRRTGGIGSVLSRLWLWIRLSFAAAPGLGGAWLVLRLASAVVAPIATLGAGVAIDGLLAGQVDRVRTGVILVALGVLLAVVDSASFNLLGVFAADQGERYVRHRVLRLLVGIPSVAHHESPEVADTVSLLREDARALGSGVERIGVVLSSLAGAVSVVVVLASQAWWLAGLAPLALLPAWAGAWAIRLRSRTEAAHEVARRLADRMLTLARRPDPGVEIRCSNAGSSIIAALTAALDAREQAVNAVRRRIGGILLLTRLLNVAAVAAALAALFVQARRGEADVTGLVVVVLLVPQIQTMAQGFEYVATLLSDALHRLERFQWLERYAREHGGADSTGRPPAVLSIGIRLDRVSFTYPQADAPTLSDLSLTIPPGSVVAVVGENGAGKSTLVKLLARLYDPTSGTILIDDQPLASIEPTAWRTKISAVIQGHRNFSFLVREAIGIGDLSQTRDDQLTRAIGRARATGFLDRLEHGLDTQLGTSFVNGTDLSGGQWQRLAIARGFMRTEPLLMLLDEPSSALDPEAEHAILTGYLEHARAVADRTGGVTVIVSHRLSTVRDADHIAFLAHGAVVETGTHAELVQQGGAYAEMFALQARAYR